MVMLLQNCRHDATLWVREVGRLGALVKSDAHALEHLGKEAGLDALCELLLVTYGLEVDAGPAATAETPASAMTPVRYARAQRPRGIVVQTLGSADLGSAGPMLRAAVVNRMPITPIQSPPVPVALSGEDNEPAPSGPPSSTSPSSEHVSALPSRLHFVREISSSLMVMPWSSRSSATSPVGPGHSVQRWLPSALASETMAADVLRLLKDVVRLNASTPRGAESIDTAIKSLGALEASTDSRPNGLPLNLVQTYVLLLIGPCLCTMGKGSGEERRGAAGSAVWHGCGCGTCLLSARDLAHLLGKAASRGGGAEGALPRGWVGPDGITGCSAPCSARC